MSTGTALGGAAEVIGEENEIAGGKWNNDDNMQ